MPEERRAQSCRAFHDLPTDRLPDLEQIDEATRDAVGAENAALLAGWTAVRVGLLRGTEEDVRQGLEVLAEECGP